MQLPLTTLDLPEYFLENREESQTAEPLCTNGTTLGNAPDAPNAPNAPTKVNKRTLESQPTSIVISICKTLCQPGSVDWQLKMLNF